MNKLFMNNGVTAGVGIGFLTILVAKHFGVHISDENALYAVVSIAAITRSLQAVK